jgi:hypothetical protein
MHWPISIIVFSTRVIQNKLLSFPGKFSSGVNVIKLFSFVTDDKAQLARGFALGNPFQLGLRI